MDFSVCSQCDIEIEGKGIHFRGRVFCCDECCEEFEVEFAASGEPEPVELEEEIDPDFADEDLGYDHGSDDDDDVFLDDDFDIKPEDF